MHPKSSYQIAPNWWLIGKMAMTWQFADMTSSSNFFDAFLFFLSSLVVTGPRFMSISSLVLELWQFSFIRIDQKSEIPPSEFCSIFGDWGELGIPNLAQMFLMKCYWMLPNARVTAFTISELLRLNPIGELKLPLPPRLGWKFEYHTSFFSHMNLHINNQKILLAID